MRSTIGDEALSLAYLFEHGAAVHADSRVFTATPDGVRSSSFGEVAQRARRLAGALGALGVRPGDRVATLCWNHQEHLEAYLAVPAMGAVLHTLNLRLSAEQLAWIANHAGDRILIVDDNLVPLLEQFRDELRTVERVIVIGDEAPGGDVSYEDLLAAATPQPDWPETDERDAALICYTSGTTGNPKGVAYSHRSCVLHAFAICMPAGLGIAETDRVLPVVPMFHANGWGLPHACWLTGADLVLPGPDLSAPAISSLIADQQVTLAGAVPTVWNDVLQRPDVGDLSSLRMILCGGSAVPRALMERFQESFGVRIIQGWGMTETGPVAALAHPPKGTPPEGEMEWRDRTGRLIPGVRARLVDDADNVLPWDGIAVGEIEVRGPWVTASYIGGDGSDRFHDGWLRTGDIGTIDGRGFIQITDRAKDVIKSGGEWISSVELEGLLMAHPDVVEAAVIAVEDERWQERPLACVVLAPGAAAEADKLRAFLEGQVPRWWLPERWTFIDAVPRTGVGKFDKKVLRQQHADGLLTVQEVSHA